MTTYTIYKFVFSILSKMFLPWKCYFTSFVVFMLYQTLNLNMCLCWQLTVCREKCDIQCTDEPVSNVTYSALLNHSAVWLTLHTWTTQECDIQFKVQPLSYATNSAQLNHLAVWNTVCSWATQQCDKECTVEPLSSVKNSVQLSHPAMWHTVCSWTTQQLCSMVARDVMSEDKHNNPLTLCIKVQIYRILVWN